MTVVWMVGTGVCWRIHNASMSTAGGEAEFIQNMPARCGNFVIDGSKAGEGSTGLWVGDINCTNMDGLIVRHFAQTGSRGYLFKSEVAWCERNRFTNCLSLNATEGVVWDNAGAGTGSFDGSHFEIQVLANANQHGYVMQGATQFYHCSFKLGGGPFFTGAGNTGVVWKIGADNSNVFLTGVHMILECEVDGTTGAGHKTIEIGTKAEYHGQGVLEFLKGGSVAFATGALPSVRFTHSGYVKVDSSYGENQVGEGLNVIGGSTWQLGSSAVATGELKIGVNGGDYFQATLANGANVLKLNNVYPGRARRVYLKLTQPAAGEKGTVTWTEPGNNVGGSAQTVVFTQGGGTAPTLQAANGAVDIIELVTFDGQHWFGLPFVG
jgi:hypothetical protein